MVVELFLLSCKPLAVPNIVFNCTGRELSHAQQYGAAACLSFPLFFIAGAGAAVFWVLGK